MKIYSYNVNGIRSAMKKKLMEWTNSINIDVLCLQEIKALESQIDLIALYQNGFKYNYFFSAKKKGYSGVGILSKYKPKHIEIGTGLEIIDDEGRVIRVDFDHFSIMSLYLPSGTDVKRINFKMQFCSIFLNYIKNLKEQIPNLIIVGDYNICHQKIDIYDPINHTNISGFLPEERKWMTSFMNECDMLDSFRMFNQNTGCYSWWSYRNKARKNNKGWRIDYAMVSKSLKNNIKYAGIDNLAIHSDHCPIWVLIEI